MNGPFEMRTPVQRGVVFVGFLTYFALVLVDVLTGYSEAAPLEDVVIAALAIPAGLVVTRRVLASAETDVVALLAGLAFVVAGLGTGYGGVSALTGLPAVPTAELVGSFALVVAVLVYLYHTWS